jgi:acetolactate synthase-1/2/3 large subunit
MISCSLGDHATHHRAYDAPLTSDIEALARPVSSWVRTATDAYSLAADGAAAIAAARTAPGQVATLILPADKAWNEGNGVAPVPPIPPRPAVASGMVDAAARILRSGEPTVLLFGDVSLRADGLALAGRVAAKSGAQFLAQTFNARVERGASRVLVERVPYFVDLALAVFKEVRAPCRPEDPHRGHRRRFGRVGRRGQGPPHRPVRGRPRHNPARSRRAPDHRAAD